MNKLKKIAISLMVAIWPIASIGLGAQETNQTGFYSGRSLIEFSGGGSFNVYGTDPQKTSPIFLAPRHIDFFNQYATIGKNTIWYGTHEQKILSSYVHDSNSDAKLGSQFIDINYQYAILDHFSIGMAYAHTRYKLSDASISKVFTSFAYPFYQLIDSSATITTQQAIELEILWPLMKLDFDDDMIFNGLDILAFYHIFNNSSWDPYIGLQIGMAKERNFKEELFKKTGFSVGVNYFLSDSFYLGTQLDYTQTTDDHWVFNEERARIKFGLAF